MKFKLYALVLSSVATTVTPFVASLPIQESINFVRSSALPSSVVFRGTSKAVSNTTIELWMNAADRASVDKEAVRTTKTYSRVGIFVSRIGGRFQTNTSAKPNVGAVLEIVTRLLDHDSGRTEVDLSPNDGRKADSTVHLTCNMHARRVRLLDNHKTVRRVSMHCSQRAPFQQLMQLHFTG